MLEAAHELANVHLRSLGRGVRIAQLVPAAVLHVALDEVTTLDDTARGSGGFGSTGT